MGNNCRNDNKSNSSPTQTQSDMNQCKIYQNTKISIIYGDIIQEDVEAIVNIANQRLKLSDGMSMMLKQSAGEVIEQEIDKYLQQRGKLENGTVMYTHGGDLNCIYIIHASLPISANSKKNETEVIENSIKNCLNLASNELKISSIALPLFYNRFLGLNKRDVAQLMIKCITSFINESNNNVLKDIRIVSKDQQVLKFISKCLDNFVNIKESQSTEKLQASFFKSQQLSEEDFYISYISQDPLESKTNDANDQHNHEISKLKYLKQSF